MRTVSTGIALKDRRFGRFLCEFRRLGAAACDLVATWIDRARERRALAGLNEHGRKDIGVSAADVEAEYRKPFWRP